jgi:phosphoglycolate phosphatase
VIGLSLVEAMAELAPAARPRPPPAHGADLQGRLRHPARAKQVEEPLFDGILPLLDALEARLAAGGRDRQVRPRPAHCLTATASTPAFCRSRPPTATRPSRTRRWRCRRSPIAARSPNRSVVIGDTGWDMGMAKAAGCHAIGALWGYHEEAELLAAGADVLAAQPGRGARPGRTLVKVAA